MAVNTYQDRYDIATQDLASITKKQNTDVNASVKQEATDVKKVIDERDKTKFDQLADQEERIKGIESTFNTQTDARRKQLDDISKRQEEIASRNANMSVAAAGASGALLSEGDKQSINSDVIGKFGDNMLAADQAKLSGNTSLDQAVKSTGLEIYAKQSEINGFKNALKDSAYAPALEAVRKAAQGDQNAINDVASMFKKYQGQIADEAYAKYGQLERINAEQSTYEKADNNQRIALVSAELQKSPGNEYALKNLKKVISEHPTESFEEIINIAKQEGKVGEDTQANTAQAIASGMADKESVKKATTAVLQAGEGTTLRNNEAVNSQTTDVGRLNLQKESAQTSGNKIVIPTTAEISLATGALKEAFDNKTIDISTYKNRLSALQKIATSGINEALYKRTWNNPDWVKRLQGNNS